MNLGLSSVTPRRLERIAVLTASGLIFALVASFRYLPLTDLPQHALQLSAWVHAHDPAFGFEQQLEINWNTPYLLGYLLARPLVPLVGVVAALKLVLAAGAAATTLAVARLARVLGLEVWWALLIAPLALGFSFAFGFLNFVLATPLTIVALAECVVFYPDGDRRAGIRLASWLALLTVTHGFGLLVAVLLCGPLLLAGALRGRSLARLWPVLGPPLVLLPWLPGYLRSGEHAAGPRAEVWRLGVDRLLELPGLIGGGGLPDDLAALYALVVVGLIAGLAGRPSRDPVRWSPLLVIAAAYLLFPFKLRGVAFLYERFAAFLVPALLVAIEPAERGPAEVRRMLQIALPTVWLAILASRFASFQEETRGWDEIQACMKPGKRVRPLIFLRGSENMPGAFPFLHFPAYYTAEKGGQIAYSFAASYTSFARYRPGVSSGIAPEKEWDPGDFNAPREAPLYDYFVAHARQDPGPSLFQTSPEPIRLLCQSGNWFLHARGLPPTPQEPR